MNLTVIGRCWVFGDNISADDGIIQFARIPNFATFDLEALRAMCFATLRPEFPAEVRGGDFVVAGRNFGHHSHPHAAVAMKASGIAMVLVESCDSQFVRKSLNTGLPILVCPGIRAAVADHDEVQVDMGTGAVVNRRNGATLATHPYSERMIEIWQAGGLSQALRLRLSPSSIR